MSSPDRVKTPLTRLERFLWASAGAWTVAVALSLSWSLAELQRHARESARIQARDAYRRDTIYRHWTASHSPVYVPVDKGTPPNPYLEGTPERDITTSSGKNLTLMNPAYMTRQVHELAREQYGVHAHLTSLKPINPHNAPDPWEEEALRAFRRGETEVSSVREMAGGKYLRLIRPLMVKQSCLKCHAEQGYAVGDIRGGMSVSVPMEPLQTAARTHGLIVIGGHAVLWAMGLASLAFWGKRLLRSDRQRRRAESELRSAKDTAEAATRAKSEFLARMSHEIRTPMNSIMGFTQMLMDDELTAEQREAAQTISRSGETLLTLIDEVLDLSKIESDRMDLEEVQFSPEIVLQDACELICARVGDRPIEVLCDVDDIPSVVLGDPTRLRQVLLNLLGNAVKFTEEGEVVAAVCGREKREGWSRLEFEIRDSGIGIPEDKLDSIFETFTQADGSTTRKYGGTGLGLGICRRLVQLMGGDVAVQSRVGEGSTFSFDVWLKDTGSTTEVAWRPTPPSALAGRRALVADRNASACSILCRLTERLGMECVCASTGSEALARIDEGGIDVGFVAADLGDLSAVELAEQVRESYPAGEIHLIGIAQLQRQISSTRAMRAGFDGVLTKPVRRTALISMLRAVLGLARQKPRATGLHRPAGEVPAGIDILLAEDNEASRAVAARMLERMGHRVAIARDGVEAVAMAQRADYDIILMDTQMPNRDGRDATRELRDKGLSLPIVALTADVTRGDRERCLEAGMDDYLTKPLRREALRDVLCRHCGVESMFEAPAVMRILLVDCDEGRLAAAAEGVQKHFVGATCRTVSGGIQACTMLGSFLPDLLAMTVPLPEADAGAVVRLLRAEERYARTSTIVVSQLPESDPRIGELRELGGLEIVSSPLSADAVIAAATRVLAAAQPFVDGAVASPRDEDAAQELGLSLGEYRQILDRFLADAPDKMDELAGAVASGDVETAERLAHAIKGDALNLRLRPVARVAARIESMARERSISAGRDELHELRRVLDGLKSSRQPISPDHAPDDAAVRGRPVGPASLAELESTVGRLQAAVQRRSLTRVTEAAEQLATEAGRLGRTDVRRLAEAVGQEAKQARLTGMREVAQRLADLMEEER